MSSYLPFARSSCQRRNREDVITLQNPHGIPTSAPPPKATSEKEGKAVAKPVPAAAVTRAKGTVPCTCLVSVGPLLQPHKTHHVGNASPYSTGLPGASLTSTSVDPQTQSSQLLWDEVCRMISCNHFAVSIIPYRKSSSLMTSPIRRKEREKRRTLGNGVHTFV